MEREQKHFFLVLLIWLDWKTVYFLNISNNKGLLSMNRQIIGQNEICGFLPVPPLPLSILPGESFPRGPAVVGLS